MLTRASKSLRHLSMPGARRGLATGRLQAAAHLRSLQDPQGFWATAAKESISWHKEPSEILDSSNPPHYRWFPDAELNVCYNAVDRHAEGGRGAQNAIAFDSRVLGHKSVLTYAQLRQEVEALAGVLRRNGVKTGDRVLIYMPMVPQALVAMLACARIGAVHVVTFGGFASHEVALRIDAVKPTLVVTATCGLEGADRVVAYRPLLAAALAAARHTVAGGVLSFDRSEMLTPAQNDAVRRAEAGTPGLSGWKDYAAEVAAVKRAGTGADPVWVPSSHPLYLLPTSGSTGTPKVVVRDSGGYATALHWALRNVFGMRPGETFCALSDIGWVVGHSFVTYAPLLVGCTTVVFEGKPIGTPDAGTFWRVVQDWGVAGMFTAPTAARAIRRDDPEGAFIAPVGSVARGQDGKLPPAAPGAAASLETLRLLLVAGERCDPATMEWLTRITAKYGVAVRDNWWSTELGWPVLAHGGGFGDGFAAVPPGATGQPVPGWDIKVLVPPAAGAAAAPAPAADGGAQAPKRDGDADADRAHDAEDEFWALQGSGSAQGAAVTEGATTAHSKLHPAPLLPVQPEGVMGTLAIRLPLPPGAFLGLWQDDARFHKAYLDKMPGYLDTGDVAVVGPDNMWSVLARIDDVINVAGHRLSTGALEAALSGHPDVAEVAVIGPNDALKGQTPVALVVPKRGVGATAADQARIASELVGVVRREIGAVAAFRTTVFVPRLPKTKSGKVLRATMKAIADGTPYKPPATIDDPAILDEITAALKGAGFPLPTGPA